MIKKLKKAFTITELVIVIAIIAILMAVLIPTFTGVFGSARQSAALQTCNNALKDYMATSFEDENTDISGTVFVSNGYAYVYLNSSLQYVGKLDDKEIKDTVVEALDGKKVTVTYTDKEGTAQTADFGTGVANEVAYTYTIKVNETIYKGCFTYEARDAKYQTENATYSRAALYTAVSDNNKDTTITVNLSTITEGD